MATAGSAGQVRVGGGGDPARPVFAQQPGHHFRTQARLVHQGNHHVVSGGCGGDPRPEGTGHALLPPGILDRPVPGEAGEGAHGLRFRAEPHKDLDAAAVEQHIGEHLHQGAVTECQERLRAEAEPGTGTRGKQDAHR